MDKKKLRILMIADIVVIVGLVVVMMVLKGQYNDQAQKSVKEQVDALHRLFLHSCRLEFVWQGERKVFDCPLPKELQNVIKQLKPIKIEH